jgi:hypothetical protein
MYICMHIYIYNIYIHIRIYEYIYMYMYIYTRKTELTESGNFRLFDLGKSAGLLFETAAQGIFFIRWLVCALCKRTSVIYPFVDEEANGSYPFETD